MDEAGTGREESHQNCSRHRLAGGHEQMDERTIPNFWAT
jgi:hypothetical protein